MSELDDSFAKLLGRQPSDTERQNLYQVRDALGLENNDALWLVLMALQHYQGQYEKFPDKIAQAAKDVLANFKMIADATVKASAEAAQEDMAKAVAETAQKVAHNISAKSKWKWACGCFVIVAIALGGILAFDMYRYEKMIDAAKLESSNSGYAIGYKEAMDEKARDAWANTPEGRMAYLFAQGDLHMLARCSGKGWAIKNGICYPHADKSEGKELIYGWKLPK